MTTAHDTVAFDEALTQFEPVLGIETHVELGTNSKMFCSCPTAFGADANTQVCPVCLGLPGSMPVVNRTAVESTIRMGLALNCSIAPWSRFARKNYFYPDMPKDYQISQYDEPLCFDGYLDVTLETDDGPREYRVEIERVHMEEDTGKLTHTGGATGRIHGADYSLVDYNRAGIPLIEIVTKPIPGTGSLAPQVAKAYVTELRDLMRALGVSDVRMEEGSLRCDVNVSLNRPGDDWGTRSETKNVNSLRSVERAVHSEIERQAAVLLSGGRVIQETRHFHEDTGRSTSGRSKEQAEDYRYFPEPDLVPVAPSKEWIEELRGTLPEVPSAKRARLRAEWGVSDHEFQTMVNSGALDLVEAAIAEGVEPAAARKWWTGELLRIANDREMDLADVPVTAAQIRRVEALVADGSLTDKMARQVFDGIIAGEGDVDDVVAGRGLAVVSDDSSLLAAIDEALAAQPDVADKIRGGKVQAAGAIVGAVMKATRGQADAAKVRALAPRAARRSGVAVLGAMLPEDVRPVDPPVPIVDDVEHVAFYVPTYMGPMDDLALMARMPNLEVVQLLTAGFENALRFLPAGRHPVQCRRRSRCEHGGTRGRAHPRLVARDRRLRPRDAHRLVALRAPRGTGGQADHRGRSRGSRSGDPASARAVRDGRDHGRPHRAGRRPRRR